MPGGVGKIRGAGGDHGEFVYVRLRKDDYSPEERAEIASRVQRLRADGRDVFVFFKHEDTPAGAVYAEELLKAGV